LQRIGEAEGAVRDVIEDEAKIRTNPKFDLYQHTVLLYCLNLNPLHLNSAGFFVLGDEGKIIKVNLGGAEKWRKTAYFELCMKINEQIISIGGFRPYAEGNDEFNSNLLKNGYSYETHHWLEPEIRRLGDDLNVPLTPSDLWQLSKNGINEKRHDL
jgi:hypothetical protein